MSYSPAILSLKMSKDSPLGHHRPVLDAIVTQIAAIGYHLVHPWQILNAGHYGIPQNRERLFLIGAKQSSRLPSYPPPVSYQVTCQEALDDLPDAERFEALLTVDATRVRRPKKLSDYAQQSRCLADQGWHYGYHRRWNEKILTNSIRTNHSQRVARSLRQHAPRHPRTHLPLLSPRCRWPFHHPARRYRLSQRLLHQPSPHSLSLRSLCHRSRNGPTAWLS